ncbi:chemotaxis protein CheW [Nocardioides sp. Kera G14]|uniref:chemotaxis protein CheW n=1 Tax=Nocardioides sp. Kera G14 TaxID=2884264 RepID=UPI001D10E324|nr:chemotaxis protein CheW [Nocardioides sp. Kera G14]UDY24091.1 chemotaxis protein CheW [Nocardioides sp. Kera G14]
MDDDAEIIAEFLVESHENLDQLDQDLVDLEQHPASRELLSSIFRTIHTIKGTSGFLAFGRLERLTHVGETLLSKLRDGEMTITPVIGDALLTMVDTVRALLDVIERTGADSDPAVDVDPVAARIQAILDGEVDVRAGAVASAITAGEPGRSAAEATDSPAVKPEPEPEPEPAEPDAEPEPEPAEPAEAEWDGVERRSAEPAEEADGSERRSAVDSSIRVDVDLLDNLMQLVGELVLTRNQILQRANGNDDVELVRASQRLDLVASELQESVMKTRMQPIGQVWSKMPRMVRDLSHQLGREVDLQMDGHETELDRSLLEALKGPLTHLVRNSMDHGIELPADRVAAGKPRMGKLLLRAFHESGQVVVEITDDGKGINPQKIADVAVERGLITRDQASRMDSKEIVNLIFRPGFSTAAEVTNVSGRGVGMDVVRTNIERIGGSVDVISEVGKGSTVRVRIPLTLAIIPALIVGEGEERYAIPQANLVELVRIEGENLARDVEELAGGPVLRLRGRLLPLVSLTEALGGPRPETDALTVVVLQSDDIRFGLCVSEVHDTQEIVVKPIGRQLKSLTMYAGAAIMGDGRVALILDVSGVADTQKIGAVQSDLVEPKSKDDDAEGMAALLVLEVSAGRRAALPLSSVARLEEFSLDRIERSGGFEVVQYRDGILPLVRLASAIGLPDTSTHSEQLSVVVHELDNRSVGIVIDRVLDVVDTHIVPTETGRRPGVTGSAIVQEHVTDLVDLEAVVTRAGVN